MFSAATVCVGITSTPVDEQGAAAVVFDRHGGDLQPRQLPLQPIRSIS